MNRAEIEVLLKTIYSGEGAAKAVADLDKISASGQKVAGSLRLAKKEAAEVFAGVSASTKARNPQLFGIASSGGGVPPTIPPTNAPISPASAPGSSGGGAGAGGVSGHGILTQFISRLFSRALSISAGLLVYRAINLPLQALTKTIKNLNDALERARKLYASALTTGLGLQFTTKRNLLSDVIGVSEKDVLQFGQAIQFIGPRLQTASDVLAKTAPNLAATAYSIKILELDLASLFALIVSDLSPAIRKTTTLLSELIKGFERFHQIIANMSEVLLKTLIETLPAGLRELAEATLNLIKAIPDSGPAPNPVSYMQQIHASALEHMGLIVGGLGGATDFAAQTAQNTKKTAEAVTKIAQKVAGGGSRSSFGDSLLYSMP